MHILTPKLTNVYKIKKFKNTKPKYYSLTSCFIITKKGYIMTILAKDMPFYQISQVSKLLGITSDRLRTYEEEGLIKPYRAKHTKDGKRLFTLEEIEWLEIIREMIKLGVTIPVIRILISSKLKISKNFVQEKDEQIIHLIEKLYSHPVYKKLLSSI